jgi:hypothetical protein
VSRPATRRWIALAAVVLLLHLAGIDWVGTQLRQDALLPKMAAPMFTRLLHQEAPAPVTAATAPPPVAEVARPQVRSIEPKAAPPARAASQPASAPRHTSPADAADSGERVAARPEDSTVAAPTAAASTAAPASSPVAVAAAATPAPGASAARRPASAPTPAASAPPMNSAVTAATPVVPAGPGLAPDGWPVDTRLNYRLGGNYRGALHGSARVQWLRQGPRYETRIDIDITLLASLTITSQGTITPRALKPEVYEEVRRGGVRRAELKGDSVLLGNGKVVPRPEGVQDAASQFVDLAHRFASGEDQLEVGRSIGLWLARPGGVDRWIYDVVGRDTLQTPELGAIDAYHLKPRPLDRPRGNITAEIWFAPSLQYLPVRIRIDMDGKDTYLDLTVLNIEQR